ncbi:MAG: hypothetical protein IKV03_05335 [Alphaproteobacteria bacterium]|nr:hypothetical protein [Alphaproteobacteria bacterium]
MKSKYFNISENQNGTFRITTPKGRLLDSSAIKYEINPKQPKYIKIHHEGGAWCTLFSYHGYALKDTMWVNDVMLNDDGSYCVQEYIHDSKWKHYDNGVSTKRFVERYAFYFSGVVLSLGLLAMNFAGKNYAAPSPCPNPKMEPPVPYVKKVASSPVQILVHPQEHTK